AQGAVLDDRRPLEVGPDDSGDRGDPAGARTPTAPAPPARRRLDEVWPGDRAAPGHDRASVRQAHRARADVGAEPFPGRAARAAGGAVEERQATEPALPRPGRDAASSLPVLGPRTPGAHAPPRLPARGTGV